MDLENKRLYNWVPWLLTLAVLSLFAILLHSELVRQDEEWQQRLALQQASLQMSLLNTQEDLSRQTMLLAQLIVKDSVVLRLIREAALIHEQEGGNGGGERSAAIREQLNELMLGYWDPMSVVRARELSVHIAPRATVFLRVHKPDRFGDDLAPIRPMLSNVFNNGVSASGMEVGHYGSGYRSIIPVFATDQAMGAPVASVEVGLGLLPARDPDLANGQAVLLHPSLVNDVLWGAVRVDIQAATGKLPGQWGVESFTHPVVKEWQAKGMLPDPAKVTDIPSLIHYKSRDYLIYINRLADYSGQQAPLMAPKVLVLTWSDITSEFTQYKSNRNATQIKYVLECLLAEVMLWFLFRYNRRHVLQLLRDHSKQLQTERDLSEHSRQRLTLALVSSESGFWEWNITSNRAIFSKEWRELCGLPADDEGTSDIEEWLSRVHPSDKRSSYLEMIRHIKGETSMFEHEYRLRVADGTYKWIFTRGKVVERLPDGKAALMLGVYTDITDRKKNEIIVVRQQAALHALIEIASAPAANAEEQLLRALAVGSRHLGLPTGIVSQVVGNQYNVKFRSGPATAKSREDRSTKSNAPVSVRVARGSVSPDLNASIVVDALHNHLCEKTYRTEDVFAIDEIHNSEFSNHPAHVQDRLESYIGVPIWVQGSVYGTLCFVSERSRHQHYDELDMDFVQLLARWVGVRIEGWLHESQQQGLLDRFDKLCNQLPGFLYQFQLRPDGSSFCPYASAGIEELYGIRPEDVMESAEKLFSVLHPDDVGWISETVAYSSTQLIPWVATFRVMNPRRGEIWVHAESRPEKIADGSVLWHGFIIDITEEKHAEIKLQEVSALREAIFDAASISIISTNTRGVIKTFNRGAQNMLGYAVVEILNKKMPTIFHLPEEIAKRADELSKTLGRTIQPNFDALIAKARDGSEDENEWTYVRKDGSRFPILLSVTALRSADGEISGYLVLGRDISELKRIDRMKTEFISTVSHELRTPLTAISGSLGIIMSGATGPLPDTSTKMLNIAHKNSLRLIHLVNDLLDMEKLVAGKMHFEMRAQSLLPIIQQSLEANAAFAAQYQVQYVLNNMCSEDARVTVDSQRLLQVMANFLSNAAKFSPAQTEIEVKLENYSGHVRVTVVDKGPGIPDEFRNRIFQKFSQADSSDSRQKGGTGLGLAICKEIIERMGGRVDFTSTAGEGSQFYFEMPCEEINSKLHDQLDSKSQTGNRLLVVEDDPEVAELLATILRNSNYRVDIAYTGRTALERLSQYGYQAVTVDLKLPDTDGLQLIQQLRTDATTHNLPVVVISANLDDERLATRRHPSFANIQWLQKPLDADTLVAAIKTAVAKKQ